MLSGQDIGWLKEVLDSVPGVVDEVEGARNTLSTPGREATITVPLRELQTDENSFLPEHEYIRDDGQPVAEDDIDQVTCTAAFFMEETGLSPKDAKFEFHFRAFMHNMDYSYSSGTISESVKRLKEIK